MKLSIWLLPLVAMAAAVPVQAQVKRTFTNMSFESPALDTAGCRVYIPQQFVNGWDTDHAPYQSENVGNCTVPAGFVHGQVQGRILEIWRGPRNNSSGGLVNGRQGVQFAELNAQYASRIFQNVCLIEGEPIRYRFSHRGRQSATTRDVMTMHVGQGGNTQIITVGTTNNGSINTPVAHQGTYQAPVPFGSTGWVDYGGGFTYAEGSGNTNIGFEAVSAAGGATSGNFLDQIQVELAPFVDFPQVSSSTPENATLNVPRIRVNGTIAAPIQVRVRIAGGSATLGTDFELVPGTTLVDGDTLLIDIPAGTYDAGADAQFALPIQVIDNDVVDGNRDIEFAILPAPGQEYLLASSGTCGGPVNTGWTYNIVDDDATVVVLKSLESVTPVGDDLTRHDAVYRMTVRNPHAANTATYSLFDRPSMDPDISIESARYQRNAEGEVTLAPPASGSAVEWTLAQERELPAGGEDVYLLNIRVVIGRGGSAANDACAGPGTGLYNLVAATVPAEQGELTSSACQPTPTPVWVVLNKALEGRAATGDQIEVRIYAAGINRAQARTSGTALPATATTGVQVFPAGDLLGFAEVVGPNGNFASGVVHSPANYAVQMTCETRDGPVDRFPGGSGADEGNRQFWGPYPTEAGDDIECTIRNRPALADLSIVKTVDRGEVVSGEQAEYSLLVSNAGPGGADGAIVRDPAVAGLSCTAAECGSTTGGAVCPAVSVEALQSPEGVTIATMPAGSSLTIVLTCTAD